VLGICLAAAPIGAWAALRGTIELPAIVLGLLVLFWVAGFDILYALQDLEYDRSAGLHSIPVALGVEGSLWLARLFHLATVGLLLWLIVLLELGGWFWIGSWLMTAMLLYEHWLLRRGDLTKLDAAFFTMNGYISLTFLAATAADVFGGEVTCEDCPGHHRRIWRRLRFASAGGAVALRAERDPGVQR